MSLSLLYIIRYEDDDIPLLQHTAVNDIDAATSTSPYDGDDGDDGDDDDDGQYNNDIDTDEFNLFGDLLARDDGKKRAKWIVGVGLVSFVVALAIVLTATLGVLGRCVVNPLVLNVKSNEDF